MTDQLLRIYHALPPRFRSVAASLYGYRLHRERYSRETDRLIEEAEEREYWSADQWTQWREDRLARLLHRSVKHVPYYRELWAERRRRGDKTSWEDLENWPLLEKEPIRKNPQAFVADDCDTRNMIATTTSGTTFKPLTVWWSRETKWQWYALQEARCQRWFGQSRRERWAHLGAKWVTPVAQRKPPFWVWNAAYNQLYMSAYHLAPDLVPHYLDAIRRYDVKYLWGYPSTLYALAKGALRLGRKDLKMSVAITDAEQMFDYQRQAIAEAFQCPVCETYGMNEICAGASECPHGTLHLWPEAGLIEVMEHGTHVAPDETGEFVCTGLVNMDMPLIRYRVGDRGMLQDGRACGCGRTMPALVGLDGRADDVLYTRDGRAIGRLCTVIQGDLAVYEAQLIQERLDRVRVKYVPTAEFCQVDSQSIADRLKACMGEIRVEFEQVQQIERGPNGKFRTVVCELPSETLRTVGCQERV